MIELFNSNLKNYIASELEKQCINYSEELGLRSNFMLLINRLRRTPIAQKRNVIKSSVFNCPQEHMIEYQKFIYLVESGSPLLKFCSRKNFKKSGGGNDPLFDDWGIVHFHFAEGGTKELMFAIVEPETIYLLAVFPHDDIWHNAQLVEIIHNEFPFLIAHLKLSDQKEVTTAEDHKQARKLGINHPIVLSDGSSYYPPGLGVLNKKESSHDTMAWMGLSRQIKAYAQFINNTYGHGVETHKLSFALGFSYDQHQQLFLVQCKSSCGTIIPFQGF